MAETRRRPGLKLGQTTSTSFQPGISGNPGGRPKKTERERSFEQVCRDHVVELVPVLAEAVQDGSLPLRDRTVAFELLAQNAYGKPVDRSVHINLGAGGASVEAVPRDVLEARAAALLSRDIPADYEEVTDKVDTVMTELLECQ